MKLKVNGEDVSVNARKTIMELVCGKGLRPERVVVEHNLRIVPREAWPETILNENDTVEIIGFFGGG